MKCIISLFLMLVALFTVSTAAMAASSGGAVPFNNYSATSGTAVKSSAFAVRGFKTKTMTVQGVAVAGHANAALSGTVLVECGPTASGPWNGCGRWQDSVGTAVSTTANGTQTWSDASPYIRASWAKTAGLVKVWLNWSE